MAHETSIEAKEIESLNTSLGTDRLECIGEFVQEQQITRGGELQAIRPNFGWIRVIPATRLSIIPLPNVRILASNLQSTSP